MIPTSIQLKLLYGKREPNEHGNGFLNVPTEEVHKMGLCVADLMELSPSIFDGTDGKSCVFVTTGLEKACGIYRRTTGK